MSSVVNFFKASFIPSGNAVDMAKDLAGAGSGVYPLYRSMVEIPGDEAKAQATQDAFAAEKKAADKQTATDAAAAAAAKAVADAKTAADKEAADKATALAIRRRATNPYSASGAKGVLGQASVTTKTLLGG